MNSVDRSLSRQLEVAAISAPKADVGPAPLTVETIDNHIYFYAGVDPDRCLALMRSLREVDNRLRNERVNRDLPPDYPAMPIWLHIQSFGGSLFPALGMIDQLPLIKSPIYSVVEGVCASAATLISMACTKRYILPNSFMLIHQVSSVAWGTYEQIKDEVHMLDMLMNSLVDFYEDRSKLVREDVRTMLTHDSWLNGDQAVASGFADEILK